MENNTENKIKKKGEGIKSLLIYLIVGFVIAFGVRLIVEPTVVVGESMAENLQDGQYMLNLKVAYEFGGPEYGDVVIVDAEDLGQVHFMVKRVIGLPGDTIEIKDNELYRNGELLYEDYIAEPMKHQEDLKVQLGEDQVWVMGDNRNNSLDSRAFGPVNYKDDVRGKVVLRLFPFDQSYKDGNFTLQNEK